MSILNASQARLIHRSQSLQHFLGENEDIYSLVKPFAKQVNLLAGNNKTITALVPDKAENGKGATKEKMALKTVIAQQAGSICSFASDYALEINNSGLYNAVNYTTSNIMYMRDAQILGFVNRIVSVVTPLLTEPDFANYPITADDLTKLTKNAGTYNDNLGKAAMIDNNSSIASSNINATLTNIQGNITRLNRLVTYFETDNPDFVEGYRKATAVNHSGIRHSGITGVIINDTTEQPIMGVTITLEGKKKTKSTTTDIDGAYQISQFGAGKCKLTITAPNYESKTMDVNINRGKITELNMSLSSQVIEFKTA